MSDREEMVPDPEPTAGQRCRASISGACLLATQGFGWCVTEECELAEEEDEA